MYWYACTHIVLSIIVALGVVSSVQRYAELGLRTSYLQDIGLVLEIDPEYGYILMVVPEEEDTIFAHRMPDHTPNYVMGEHVYYLLKAIPADEGILDIGAESLELPCSLIVRGTVPVPEDCGWVAGVIQPIPEWALERLVIVDGVLRRKVRPLLSVATNKILFELPKCLFELLTGYVEIDATRGERDAFLDGLARYLLNLGVPDADIEELLQHVDDGWLYAPGRVAEAEEWVCYRMPYFVLEAIFLEPRSACAKCPNRTTDPELEERVSFQHAGTIFRFRVTRRDGDYMVERIVPKEFRRIGVQDPYGAVVERWEDQSTPGKYCTRAEAMRQTYRWLPDRFRVRGAELLDQFFDQLEMETRWMFSEAPVLQDEGRDDGGMGHWRWNGRLVQVGHRLWDGGGADLLRRAWEEFPDQVRLLWGLLAANVVRFALMGAETGVTGIMPSPLLLGPRGVGKTAHAVRAMHYFGGAEGTGQDLLGTGHRLLQLMGLTMSPVSPIFIDDPRSASDRVAIIIRTLPVRAYQDFQRGLRDGSTVHYYTGHAIVYAANSLRVPDAATRDRLFVIPMRERPDPRPLADIYPGGLPRGAMLALIARVIEHQWDDVASLWTWPAMVDRQTDSRHVALFGQRLVSLALGLPVDDVIADPANQEGIDGVMVDADRVVATALARLWDIRVHDEAGTFTTLGAALADRRLPRAEVVRLEAQGILSSSCDGRLGVRVDSRWTYQHGIASLRDVAQYMEQQGMGSYQPQSYGLPRAGIPNRWRLFIPLCEDERAQGPEDGGGGGDGAGPSQDATSVAIVTSLLRVRDMTVRELCRYSGLGAVAVQDALNVLMLSARVVTTGDGVYHYLDSD